MKNFACLVLVLAVSACGTKSSGSTDGGPRTDSGGNDLGTRDGGADDGAVADDATVLDDGGEPPCESATTCGACVDISHCGFCPGMGCFDSNADGPNLADGGTGMCEGFAWVSTECPDYDAGPEVDAGPPPSCEAANSLACGACTAEPFCGHCPTLGCVNGTSDGPLYEDGGVGTCEGWAYYATDCADSDAGVEDAGVSAVDAGPP